MRKLFLLVFAVFMGFFGFSTSAFAQMQMGQPMQNYQQSPSYTQQMPSNQSNPQSNNVTVTIQNYSFNPSTVTVPVGGTVTWVEQDNLPHTSTSDSGAEQWDSGGIEQGKSYSHTFTKPGTYTYHCTPHPFMKGTVVVTSGGTGNQGYNYQTPNYQGNQTPYNMNYQTTPQMGYNNSYGYTSPYTYYWYYPLTYYYYPLTYYYPYYYYPTYSLSSSGCSCTSPSMYRNYSVY